MDEVLPGFRFYPTEEELISFYLHHKLRGTRLEDIDTLIPLLDIYQYNPWDLPRSAESEQWFFFSRQQEREARGGRPNRLTAEGYWKATGSPGDVYSSQNCVIGRKRTMVYYVGRAPNGTKTPWKMNEYKAVHSPPNPQLREELSICRIYKKARNITEFNRRPPLREQDTAVPLINHPSPAESSMANVVNPGFHHQSLQNENENEN
ncbi:NAC domain-containing protein 90-like isoform X2 [Salvia splendens]|uniref:NAC domain-containing protein 90-like isoform X2 n=1 Tax=Salvia splendens TaxID=180675 RepID=UPI001C27E369|nr:NAC domain-containing protein 90-like isoform X2 [Salvia splendens]